MINGGKLIARGSNSCVFKPSIPCNDNIKPSIKRVSKIIYDEDAEDMIKDEQKQTNLILKIKDYENWAIVFDTFCESPKYSKLLKYDEKGINECIQYIFCK